MATISSKLLVQLPALLFSVFVIVMSRQAWSNDHITTYKFTPKNGEPSRMVIRERIIDGVHLYLSRIQSDAEVSEATHQSVTGVMTLLPDPNDSGDHVMFNRSPSLGRVSENSSIFRISDVRMDMTEPSYDELSELLGNVNQFIRFALPLPRPQVHIPAQSEGVSQEMQFEGFIQRPGVVASDDNATFTVSGVMRGAIWGLQPPGIIRQQIATEDISVTAVLTHNPEDRRVQLERFEIGEYLTLERESFRESGEHDEIFEAHWNQLEEDQRELVEKHQLALAYAEILLGPSDRASLIDALRRNLE